MITFLLITLIMLDLGLLAAVFYLNRRQDAQLELVGEMTEERRILTELRNSIQEELEASQQKMRESTDKVSGIALEAEQEVKNGGDELAKRFNEIADQLSSRFEAPLQELAKRRGYIESLLKNVDKEKAVLQKVIARGEKIVRFFDDRVPFEEVLHEIEDKKYADARHLISQGIAPDKIARDLGMSESQVRLVADLAPR